MKYIVLVPPCTTFVPIQVTSFPACEPVRKRIVLPRPALFMAVAVVSVDVVPPLAVTVLLHCPQAPQAQAPKVPARAIEGTCIHPSSSTQ